MPGLEQELGARKRVEGISGRGCDTSITWSLSLRTPLPIFNIPIYWCVRPSMFKLLRITRRNFFFSFFWIGYQLYVSVLSSSAAVCLCYLTRPWVLWNQRYAFHVCVFSAWYTVSSQQLSDLGMTECINALLKLLLLELLPFWPWLGSLLFSRVKEGVHRLRISSSSQKYQKAFLCYF